LLIFALISFLLSPFHTHHFAIIFYFLLKINTIAITCGDFHIHRVMPRKCYCIKTSHSCNGSRSEGDTSPNNAQERVYQFSKRSATTAKRWIRSILSFLPPHDLLSSPLIKRIIQDVSANYPGGLGNFENFAKYTAGLTAEQQQQKEMSQEASKEKINLLIKM
jgi:hypothetical protein